MKYITPNAEIIEFEAVSVILTSAEQTTTAPIVDGDDDDRLPDTPAPLNFYE